MQIRLGTPNLHNKSMVSGWYLMVSGLYLGSLENARNLGYYADSFGDAESA